MRPVPENPFFAHKLGLLLSSAGEKDHGVEILKTAAASENATAKVQADFAMAAFRAGQIHLAKPTMQLAADKIPVSAGSKTNLRELRRRADAIEIAQAVWNALRTSD